MPDNPYTKEEEKQPKHPHHDIPPFVMKELLELREKIGKLEGMMEILLKQQS